MDVRKALLAPVAVLLLASCSGSGSAAPGPATLPPLETTTASPPAEPVQLPPEATPDTAQGAAAFARYYYEVLGEVFQDGDVRRLEQLSDPACETCNNFVRVTREETAQGLVFEGGEFDVLSAEASSTVPGDAVVDIFYNQAPSVIRDRTGAEVDSGPGESRVFAQMRVLRDESGWRVRAIRFPEVPS